jgi:hypothetical protein
MSVYVVSGQLACNLDRDIATSHLMRSDVNELILLTLRLFCLSQSSFLQALRPLQMRDVRERTHDTDECTVGAELWLTSRQNPIFDLFTIYISGLTRRICELQLAACRFMVSDHIWILTYDIND